MTSGLLALASARFHRFLFAAILLVSASLFGSITVRSPSPNTSITSPIRFVASATPTSTSAIVAMQVYVDGVLKYNIPTSSVDVFLPLSIGQHTVAFKAWDSSGASQIRSQINTVAYGVSIASPTAGVSLKSPVHISAAAKSSMAIVSTKVYVDGSQKFSTSASSVDISLSMAAGTRNVVVQSWDQGGKIYKQSLSINVITTTPQLIGRDQFLQQKYHAGPAHIDGRYGFTFNNFLLEGASRIRTLGSHSIFVYLYPGFRTSYPDKSAGLWPATNPTSLTQLAQTSPYKQLFAMNYNLFVLTTFTFTNRDNVLNFNVDPTAATREEQEIYSLTKYLLTTYKGSGKTFILKNWETDQFALNGDNTANISSQWISALKKWFAARQRGVARARQDAGNPVGVAVLHAIEVSRVLDYTDHHLTRTINAVVPAVKPDMVTYSSYDSSLLGTDSTSLASAMNRALNTIKSLSADPMYLRNRRILISEYGLFENERPTETTWRTSAILQTAKSAGLSGAFLWQIYDNECKMSNGDYFPVDSSPGSLTRPVNADCRGLWLIKPDGTKSAVLPIVSGYW